MGSQRGSSGVSSSQKARATAAFGGSKTAAGGAKKESPQTQPLIKQRPGTTNVSTA
jgi:hypothetical protein